MLNSEAIGTELNTVDFGCMSYKKVIKVFEMIGEIVTVTIDRPLGSYHPKHPNIYYSVNYGYIKGIPAADGDDQDAYVLGVDEPVSEFVGRVIAVIEREDDAESKWVVAPDGVSFTAEEIVELTYFQEQYFKSTVRLLI